MSGAQVLRMVSGLMEDGCPAPMCVTLPSHGCPGVLQVRSSSLGEWLTALDLVEPTWFAHKDDDGEEPVVWFAHWPADEFAELPFRLECVKFSSVVAA